MKAKFLIATVAAACFTAQVFGESDPPPVEELPAVVTDGPIVIYRKVYTNETLPELGARLYDRVDYELKLLKLDRDIRIAELDLENSRDRALVYNKYFGRTGALLVTRQNAKADILKSEEQLKLLRREKLLALRHRNDQIRYRKLLLAEDAGRVQVEN